MAPADTAPARSTWDHLERGRRSYAARAWKDAYAALSSADRAAPLGGADLDLLAASAGLLGRYDEHLTLLERAHQAFLETGETLRAVRCAFWVGMFSAQRGELARATGWFGRAQRLLEREDRDCAERGYLLVTVMTAHEEAGDLEAAIATTIEATRIGEGFRDADLVALALYERGRLLAKQGKIDEGLGLFDEVMVAVTTGELSPIVTGILYCSVIAECQRMQDLRRAREWTTALTRWCREQPEMFAFTARCLVHRAEIMQVDGAWPDALGEARRAAERYTAVDDRVAIGESFYRQAEIHRLRGDNAAAEAAYREASRCGWEPQPGLALLRLAQGANDVAVAAIRRVLSETTESMRRAGLLPAYLEIMLAVSDLDEARRALSELEEIAEHYRGGTLGATAAHARGAVALAEGDAEAALVALREAAQLWHELGAPYELARVRVLVGLACRQVGDADAAEMELDAARRAFEELGAAPDVARVEALTDHAPPVGGLTPREVEVVRLVASGRTNRAIADELLISEKTVARHMSNVFTKLGVSSRSAVTAFAYEHDLVSSGR
jgi:DNA-binding CsgD family transcriptional regulator/tetratricopeptide (TPR) repeat protein